MESVRTKKQLKNDSAVKLTYTFESNDYKEAFVAAFFKLSKMAKYPIGDLQIHIDTPTICITTRMDNLCNIFYVMGALAERDQKFQISLN